MRSVHSKSQIALIENQSLKALEDEPSMQCNAVCHFYVTGCRSKFGKFMKPKDWKPKKYALFVDKGFTPQLASDDLGDYLSIVRKILAFTLSLHFMKGEWSVAERKTFMEYLCNERSSREWIRR